MLKIEGAHISSFNVYECVPTPGQLGSEFQRGRGRTDLASAYVLCCLISLGSVFQVAWVRATAGRTEVWCIPDWRESEGLGSKRIVLSRYLN